MKMGPEASVIHALREAVEKYPAYGFPKLFKILRRWGYRLITSVFTSHRFRTFNVVDDFNREALAIEVDLNLPAPRVIRVLERIAAWRGYPDKVRMDNGPEFVSMVMAGWAEDHAVELEFIQPGKPTQNSFIERFNPSYRDEVLNMYVFRNLKEVREITDRWIREYNNERPNMAIGGITPIQKLAKAA